MSQPSDAPNISGRSRSPVAAHPVTSAIIAILILASVFFAVYVPLYASPTPKVGDFPFFYFYLLIYMPATALALWLAMLLQRRLKPRQAAGPGSAGDAVPGGVR